MTGNRPAVLVFARFYLPGYRGGGPIRTIANLVEALGDEIDFRIVTSDRDWQDRASYPEIASDWSWKTVGKARVLYLSPVQRTFPHIARILRQTPYDVLYLNSVFDPTFTLKPLLARRLGLARGAPCIVAPRGEFSIGALALKRRRKSAYLMAARLGGLYRGVVWQASSLFESADIARAFGLAAKSIHVAANLPTRLAADTVDLYRPRAPGAPLRICFLSRIAPMKNLDFALQVLAQVRTRIQFDIYGDIIDHGFWQRCERLIAALPRHATANFMGGVAREQVMPVLSRYDVFFLPTRGENYGHAILESLAAGTPVLISTATPWRDLSRIGIGWDLPLDDPSAFVACIDEMASESERTSVHRRRLAKAFARQHQDSEQPVEDNRILLGLPPRAAA